MMKIEEMLSSYKEEIACEINELDEKEIIKIVGILKDAYDNDRQVFVVGNGGSAGTANHFVCDFGKNAVPGKGVRRFRVLSVCDNVEKITALGNDICFEDIFAYQLENLARPDDVLLVISASGNSENLVRACKYMKKIGGHVIALSGFGGGKICDGADAAIITQMRSYERIEDLQLIITHMLVCSFKQCVFG